MAEQRGIVSKEIFELIANAVSEKDASAPNSIADAVNEILIKHNIGDELAEAIYDRVQDLVSELVVDYGSDNSPEPGYI